MRTRILPIFMAALASLLLPGPQSSAADEPKKSPQLSFDARILAVATTPFDLGLRTTSPSYKAFVVGVQRWASRERVGKVVLVRYEYGSWEKVPEPKSWEDYGVLWRFSGVREKACDASLKDLEIGKEVTSTSSTYVNPGAERKLPSNESVLPCVVVSPAYVKAVRP
jgi:hypothetical protein